MDKNAFHSHVIQNTKQLLAINNTEMAVVIPGSLTSILQQLMSIWKSFLKMCVKTGINDAK